MRARALAALLTTAACACTTPPLPGASDGGFDAGDAGPAVDAGMPEDAGRPPEDGGPPPVEAVAAGVARVKNLLVGLPATAEEIATVKADRNALQGLVAQWMAMPEYDGKMLQFLSTAFQQTQVNWDEMKDQFRGLPVPPFPYERNALFMQNLRESFGRTAMQLIAEGRPFSDTMKTRRFMMTPALMATYALLDVLPVPDNPLANVVDPPLLDHTLVLESDTPIPIEESVDPNSPNFMRFYDASIATEYMPGCPTREIVFPAPIHVDLVHSVVMEHESPGFIYDPQTHSVLHVPTPPAGSIMCRVPPRSDAERVLRDEDFSTWHMVEIRQPRSGETTTPFYGIPSLRTANELVLRIPRIGFFSTLSFFAQWPTNLSNLARVTINQTMIVSLGLPFNLSNDTMPNSLAALDPAHAPRDSTCYGCHMTLDPMRQFFRQAYTITYSAQTDPAMEELPGEFAFHGVTASGTSISDLGATLASHPLLAKAWVQKLCTYANSAPCEEEDPEFMRIVNVFSESGLSWSAVVKALFSSPIVSGIHLPQETDVFPMSRQAHLCATLSNRLAIPDVCGLDVRTQVPADLQPVQLIAASWPSDQYGRGAPTPILANAPSLFTRTGLEGLCSALADHLVDNETTGHFDSTAAEPAMTSFVSDLMGLSGERADGPSTVLHEHFDKAVRAGFTPGEALKSTFVLACLSPWVAGVGL